MREPSKYDALTAHLCASLHAEAVILIVKGGTLGSGAARAETPLQERGEYNARCSFLAAALRAIADDVERQLTEPVQGWEAARGKPG